MNIRPKQGMLLVEMLPEPTTGAIIQEEKYATRAKVLRLGMWAQAKNGALLPWEVKVGDTVIINRYAGDQLQGYPERYKLLHHYQVDGVLVG